jgi:hypothetical protein
LNESSQDNVSLEKIDVFRATHLVSRTELKRLSFSYYS